MRPHDCGGRQDRHSAGVQGIVQGCRGAQQKQGAALQAPASDPLERHKGALALQAARTNAYGDFGRFYSEEGKAAFEESFEEAVLAIFNSDRFVFYS